MLRTKLLIPIALVVLGALSACTPEEVSHWRAWHDVDPVAAEEFANLPEIQQAAQATQQAVRVEAPEYSSGNTVWDRLAQCESGGNWAINTGNGYYGGLQFLLSTWRSVGGSGYPHQNSREEQIYRAEKVLDASGWGAWPACARKLGLR